MPAQKFTLVVAVVASLALLGCRTVQDVAYVRANELDRDGRYAEAFGLYKAVAEAESYEDRAASQFRLAEMYREGTGTARDPRQALRWYQTVADGPDRRWRNLARVSLGRFHEEGWPGHLEVDRGKASQYYRAAAEDGYDIGKKAFDRLTRYPDVYVLHHASEFRHASNGPAPGGIASAYKAFKAGDYQTAFPVFLWHARNGNEEAQSAVATFYKSGLGVEKDTRRYVAWTYLAARNGNAKAQTELGLIYRQTDLVPGGDRDAKTWFSAASKQGQAEATNWLGIIALHPLDDGERPDAAQALRYFREAAEGGSAHALVNLGDMYLGGVEVEANRETAKGYYMAAAGAGNLLARRRLFEEFAIVHEGKAVAGASSPTARISPPIRPIVKETSKPTPVELFARVSPAVIRLFAVNVKQSDQRVSQGSAVVLSETTALTNCHVLEGKEAFGAKIKDEIVVFSLIQGNRKTDLCAIRSKAKLVPISETRKFEALKVGEKVYAIGSPKSLENTLSEGIISALRTQNGVRYIQTTAPISQGSSGGGLFDESGRLIGITTFKIGGENLNFAVAIDEALELLQPGTRTGGS